MNLKKLLLRGFVAIMIILSLNISNIKPFKLSAQNAYAAPSVRTDAVVLVNSASSGYIDFQHFVQPYLDNLGVPYTLLDIATTAIGSNISDYAVIIIGHRSLDPNHSYLDATEQSYIRDAVSAGTGLVNFDNLVGSGGQGYYQFINNIFSFSYTSSVTRSGVTFGSPLQEGYQINLWEDTHQNPVLPTTTNVDDLSITDNQWTEFLWEPRGYPGIFAGYDETLPLMHFFSAIPNGEYTLIAHLYWNQNLRYYWGYTSGAPTANYYDVTSGTAGGFSDYALGTVQVTNDQFDLYVQDADPLTGGNYPYYGWAWVRLVPTTMPSPVQNYITNVHQPYEVISTGDMVMAGISLPATDTALAWSGDQPFLAIANYGQGRAVQWGTYSWMSSGVKGPVYGLDDLVWRSIVWAARKPFVMQGMPPFVTLRVFAVAGPIDWANTAIQVGFKPWMGLYYQDIDTSEAAAISALVNGGKATASVYAKAYQGSFYFNHLTGDLPDDVIAANYVDATAFHSINNIPISKYVLPSYYEIGTNAFQGLGSWGVEFVGTLMLPGDPYHAVWLNAGPFYHNGTGSSSDVQPVYYADYLTIPNHPDYNNHFFDCITEIRDDAGYEWYPSSDVQGTIGRGTRQTERALNSMVLASLFTQENNLQSISTSDWLAELQGIQANIEPYGPIYVTMDYACQYVRAIHNSNITAGSYDLGTNVLTTTLSVVSGSSIDMATKFYVFTQDGSNIRQIMVDVPVFSGSTEVSYTLPGALDHIGITPASATILEGGKQTFSAMGYDASNNPIPNLPIRWSVVNGGGTIDMDGVFTAGSAPGIYANTVRATYNGVHVDASVQVDRSVNAGVTTGWNMVSVPVQAANMQLSVLYPGIFPPAYYYTTTYQPVQGSDTLVTGRGYWMYFTSGHPYSISGQLVSPQDIPVSAGWNMIGPFDHTVEVSAITSTPGGILFLPVYGYVNGYSAVTTLQPGVGYWAYVTQSGTLHLGGGGGLAMNVPQVPVRGPDVPQDFRLPIEVSSGDGKMTAVLGVSPQGSAGFDAGLDQLAPPPAPSGAFDVRWANGGDQFLVDVRNSQPGEYTFTLRYSPAQDGENIVLRWDAEKLAGLGTFKIVDLAGGKLYTLDMSTVDELVIHPGSVLYNGLQIQVKTDQPRYPTFLPLLVH